MAMPIHRNETGHVTPDGIVYHQRLDSSQVEHEELRHIDDDLVDASEYVSVFYFRCNMFPICFLLSFLIS